MTSTTTPTSSARAALERLADTLGGRLHLPDGAGFGDSIAGFQTGVRQRPAAVVVARDAPDVAAAVATAAAHDLPVGVQATGHGLSVPTDGGVLLSTRNMRAVAVNPARRVARVAAGTRMGELIAAAAVHGLAPVAGSSPHVGVVGYTLAGGYGLLGRAFGFAADHVRALEVVTADSVLRRVTPDEDADLFWALRGGRDNLGIVTAMDIDLVAVDTLVGGGLFFDVADAPPVLDAFAAVTADAPDGLTVLLGAVGLPDLPDLPPPLRGRHVLHVRVASTVGGAGDRAVTDRAVARLRAAGTVLLGDVTDLALTDVGTIVNEPNQPHGYDGTNVLLSALDADDLAAILALAGPAAPVPCVLDVRPLGGALAREPQRPSAVPFRRASWIVRILSPIEGDSTEGNRDEERAAVRDVHRQVLEMVEPHGLGRAVGFVYGKRSALDEVADLYEPDTLAELRRIKRRHDPRNLFRATHNLLP